MEVVYNESIRDKLVKEITQHKDKINHIRITRAEYCELLKCLPNCEIWGEKDKLIHGKQFMGIYIFITDSEE